MGFSVSATMAIFFATFLIFFIVIYESSNEAFQTVSDSLEEKYDSVYERTQVSFELVNVYYDREENVLCIQVKNVGSISLNMEDTDAVIGGVLVSSESLSTRVVGVSDTRYWHPNDVLEVNVSYPGLSFSSSVADRRVYSTDRSLSAPGNLSVSDQIYVIDGSDIEVFDLDGIYRRTVNDPSNVISPTDIKVMGDHIYVLDSYSHIDRLTKSGSWVDAVVSDPVNLSNPRAFAVDSDYFYVVDDNDHVDRFTLSGAFVDTIIPNGGLMSSPQDIFVSDGIYIIDQAAGSYSVLRYELDGTGGSQLIGSLHLSSPRDIAVSDAELDETFVYVVNNTREIAVFDSAGSPVGSITAGLSSSVRGVDVTGRIFVTDEANGLICEYLGTSIKLVFDRGTSMTIEL